MLSAALFVALAIFCAVCRADEVATASGNFFSKQKMPAFSADFFSKLQSNAQTGLRPEAVTAASSWVVLQNFSGKQCTLSTLASAAAVGVGQCYPFAAGGFAMATVTGSTVAFNTYTTDTCTGTGTPVPGAATTTGVCQTDDESGLGFQVVVQTTAGPTSSYPSSIVLNYYGTLSNCQTNSGTLYGWGVYAGNCVPLDTNGVITSATVACSGTTLSGNTYATGKCTGASTPYSNVAANAQCANTFTTVGVVAVGPYTTCFSPPAAASSSSVCFAGSETVELASGAIVPISEVKVGDKVLAFSASAQSTVFSDVVATPHPKNNQEAVFQHIVLASGKDIKMTADHLVSAGKCDLAAGLPLSRAADVQTGDCVQTTEGVSTVMSNNVVSNNEGVYTIVTDKSDDLVVINGIVASPFAVNHAVANAVYNVHRMLYSVAPKLVAPVAAVMSGLAAYFTK